MSAHAMGPRDCPARFTLWSAKPSPCKLPAVAAALPSWRAFFDAMGRMGATEIADPLARPAWAAYVLSGSRRSNTAVECLTGLTLDIDHANPKAVEDTLRALEALGCLAYVHTTWSYDPGPDGLGEIRLRIFVPTSTPIAPTRAPNAQLRLAAALRTDFDPATKDIARLYFLPCKKPGAADVWSRVFDGHLLDWTSLSDPKEVSSAAIRTYGVTLRRALATVDLGTALCEAMDGLPFAAEGRRDTMAWEIACALHRKFPSADPGQIAALFARSIATMTTGAPDMAEKLARAFATRATVADEDIDRMREFWTQHGDPERTEPYNSIEREGIVSAYGRFSGVKWALSGGAGVHFLTHEGYTTAVPMERAGLAALTALAPAPISLRDETGTAIGISAVLSAHGSDVRKVQWSLYDVPREEQFEEATSTLTICRTPMRDLKPARSIIAEEYLHALVGPKGAATLTRWLSLCTDLSDILPAIYLYGPPGAGKGTFASALSAGWGSGGATSVQEVFEWSEAMLNNPILLIDEVFPTNARGKAMTPEFRSLLGERTHTCKGKYKDSTKILGCPRVVMTCNNAHMLNVGNDHSDDDIKALLDRCLVFHVSTDGERYLENLPLETRRAFIGGDFFRHVLYLAQVPAAREGRFGILNTNQEFRDSAVVGFGLRPLICQWIVAWLENPGAPVAFGARGKIGETTIRVVDGRVLVRAGGLYANWETHLPGTKRPDSLTKVATNVAALSIGPADSAGWCTFDLGKLHAFCRMSMIMGPAVLETLLSKAGAPAAGGVVLPFPGPYGGR